MQVNEGRAPVIWVIGATRSSKTPFARGLAEKPPSPLAIPTLSTGDYYRLEFGQEDTFSRDFVFRISAHSARHIAGNHDCHIPTLEQFIDECNGPCIIEGERHPFAFAKLFDPQKDMAFILFNDAMCTYDTTIEGGIKVIDDQLRWAVKNRLAPQDNVMKFTFNKNKLWAHHFGSGYDADKIIHQDIPPLRYDGDKYPFIDPMIAMAQNQILKCLKDVFPDKAAGPHLPEPCDHRP